MHDIQITTHNKNYSYRINNQKRLIEYVNNNYKIEYRDKFNHIVTGVEIISAFTTMDDMYLFCISKSENVVYCYTINQSNGTILLYRKHNACFLQSLLNECYKIKEN